MPIGLAEVWPAITIALTFGISLAHVIYRMGHLTARLEAYRIQLRIDMHEVSTGMGQLAQEIRELHTLMEERTQRRNGTDVPWTNIERRS